jgi:hypothetical protein
LLRPLLRLVLRLVLLLLPPPPMVVVVVVVVVVMGPHPTRTVPPAR